MGKTNEKTKNDSPTATTTPDAEIKIKKGRGRPRKLAKPIIQKKYPGPGRPRKQKENQYQNENQNQKEKEDHSRRVSVPVLKPRNMILVDFEMQTDDELSQWGDHDKDWTISCNTVLACILAVIEPKMQIPLIKTEPEEEDKTE